MKHPVVSLMLAALLALAAAMPAHAATGGLIVKCNIEGARVLLDGKDKGACPTRVFTTPGQHTLELRQPIDGDTFYFYQTQVNLPDGEPTKVNAELAVTYTEEGWYKRGNDDKYLNSYPNGKYAKAIQEKRRKAEEEKRRTEREAQEAKLRAEREKQEALNRAAAQKEEAQRQVGSERKQQGAEWRKQFDAKVAELGATFRDCSDCPEMVVIPPGNFVMGSADPGASGNEWPPHAVTITRPFAMGKTEVTQGQWKAVMGNNPSYFSNCGDTCPVERVSWDDAQEFIKKLNAKTGKTYHLPSEAEWEYACRAGGHNEYCGSDDVGSVGWYDKNSGNATHPAAQKQANAFGLYDMSGNVWEWVEDSYHDTYNGALTDGSAWSGDGATRVLRGGSWFYIPDYSRSANRDYYTPAFRFSYCGFRVARTLP